MDAEVEERVRRPGAVPPEDECLTEQVDGERLARRQSSAEYATGCQHARSAGAWPATDGEVMPRPYATDSVAAVTGAADARSE